MSEDVYEQPGVLERIDDDDEGHHSFGYRIVLEHRSSGVEANIYEVYFDDAGGVVGWVVSKGAYGFDESHIEKSVSELRDDLEMMLSAFQEEVYTLVHDGEDDYLELAE